MTKTKHKIAKLLISSEAPQQSLASKTACELTDAQEPVNIGLATAYALTGTQNGAQIASSVLGTAACAQIALLEMYDGSLEDQERAQIALLGTCGLATAQMLGGFATESALMAGALEDAKNYEALTEQNIQSRFDIPPRDFSNILSQPSNETIHEEVKAMGKKIESLEETIIGLQEVMLELVKQLKGYEEPSEPDEPTYN